jgi:hypothetical protein
LRPEAREARLAPAGLGGNPVLTGFNLQPLGFEVNQGQTDPTVQYVAHGSGYGRFLTPGAAVFQLHQLASGATGAGAGVGTGTGAGATLSLQLVGANPSSQIVRQDPLAALSNCFIGDDPACWRTNIATYEQVQYQQVDPGIDLLYHGNQQRLEYDFTVAPGANPQSIVLNFQGQQSLEIVPQGNLVLHTPPGTSSTRRRSSIRRRGAFARVSPAVTCSWAEARSDSTWGRMTPRTRWTSTR